MMNESESRNLYIKLAVDNLYWRMKYDDANPDVGMGLSVVSAYDDMVKQLKLDFTDAERKKIISIVMKQRNEYDH